MTPLEIISVVQGDITRLDVDAIVNAANGDLLPGGGVCGAIHRAAGPKLLDECYTLEGCPTGEARMTKGYNLKARHVIHAVGPIWQGGGVDEEKLLARCYRNAMMLALDNDLVSMAFPAISTGVYGFPAERAAIIAVATLVGMLKDGAVMEQIKLCCFNEDSVRLHQTALAAITLH